MASDLDCNGRSTQNFYLSESSNSAGVLCVSTKTESTHAEWSISE